MPKVLFLPHKILLPKSIECEAQTGETILTVALRNNIKLEHACEQSCACSTCHCIIKKGFFSLSGWSEKEDDILDKAWGLQSESRLSCQAVIGKSDIEVEIPLYNLNYTVEY
ncbi:ISC system 2Fe-2S type ferredoxin [Buchnera aphidicola str. APS (Acyrthosiphon pisum)]|uniref:2Fe-2S ferredoxin n=2 Tax=Buchnera aphidicola TaxID=9 RepID=FER_BUCAI|nr:ISC system 2Fe-2S type ferredoxin [Buchnera aphidicola]P57661.1 RecName: Full=2Fe-2S ferredoxin [Buchnera aphidicola str. APS (Acyrthosiphon pisum)]pir/B85000/ ferredoxin 2fe-2s [imported] - Buchnera sp. (strain APS) [Buchnera sp. (in: enterobacteria)]ADP68047.1 ferredoxin 2fe-2s [Buchnera aphidicola str. JF98 (Acyrthosiphon pisum)]OQX98327.1 MAG: ISC system 2Fe-2S type ferredoxin [Erwiniaceae bacterium 4572_131]ACL30385.1 ferredoxin 2fe-2s [Buchnera aphidicola str. Tuc7 (Acyrthosiphon pisu